VGWPAWERVGVRVALRAFGIFLRGSFGWDGLPLLT
jgi:hypothetical protein